MRWNKQKAQLRGLGKDLQSVQKTDQPNKVIREPQETAQIAALQLEVIVYKNYIPLCAVLICIVGLDFICHVVILWMNNLKETPN